MEFLNVDVEVRDGSDLASVREALEAVDENVSVLYCGAEGEGRWLLSFEVYVDSLGDPEAPHDPDAVAAACCAAIERLPLEARARWDAAEDRVFDFGFTAIATSRAGLPLMSAGTVEKVADLGARVAVSVYAHDIVSRETTPEPPD